MLQEREARRRQDLLDSMTQKGQDSLIADRTANREIQAKQLLMQQQQHEAMMNNNEFNQAKDIVENAGGNEFTDAPTALRLTKAGFGGRLQKEAVMGTPGIGVLQPEDLPADAQVATEGRDMIKPGFKYEMARQAAAEKDALAQRQEEEKAAAATAAANRSPRSTLHSGPTRARRRSAPGAAWTP